MGDMEEMVLSVGEVSVYEYGHAHPCHVPSSPITTNP